MAGLIVGRRQGGVPGCSCRAFLAAGNRPRRAGPEQCNAFAKAVVGNGKARFGQLERGLFGSIDRRLRQCGPSGTQRLLQVVMKSALVPLSIGIRTFR